MATPARIVSFGRGARWLAEGWRLFLVAPLPWIALAVVYYLVLNLVLLVPVVGILVAPVLVPAFSVGFMAASRAAAHGGLVGTELILLLFSGFRENPRGQLVLGLVFLACLALLLGATTLLDQGALAHSMLTDSPDGGGAQEDGGAINAMLVAIALYIPVMMAYWFSPVLVAWHRIGVAKALVFSFLACALNWRAFLAYGAVATLFAVVAPSFALSALMYAAGGKGGAHFVALLYAFFLVMLPTLVASFYVSYRDIFGTPETD
jgi:hypothetical protein